MIREARQESSGRGWDLQVSTISVRGPAPLYHPMYETEDYTLDGQDLIALNAKGEDICITLQKVVQSYRECFFSRTHIGLRNNSDGLIVRRYGDSPNTYFWEVWNSHTRVTRPRR